MIAPMMQRLMIQAEPELVERAKRRARERGVSVAQVVREAMEHELAIDEEEPIPPPLSASASSPPVAATFPRWPAKTSSSLSHSADRRHRPAVGHLRPRPIADHATCSQLLDRSAAESGSCRLRCSSSSTTSLARSAIVERSMRCSTRSSRARTGRGSTCKRLSTLRASCSPPTPTYASASSTPPCSRRRAAARAEARDARPPPLLRHAPAARRRARTAAGVVG